MLSPQPPPTLREDSVRAGAKNAEDENGQYKKKQAAYLATAFGLPAIV
jgi:hypothetical protein